LAALRRRAEQAETALRTLAGQHAVEKAALQHEIEELKKALAAAKAAQAAPAAAFDEWAAEVRRRFDEDVERLRRRLAGG